MSGNGVCVIDIVVVVSYVGRCNSDSSGGSTGIQMLKLCELIFYF